MKVLSPPILAALFASVVIGWDPSERDCPNVPVCFTSFKWCDPNGDSCYFPDNVYPASPDSSRTIFALLVEDKNYTLSWKIVTGDRNIPVRVQWSLGQNATWETNTTDAEITFNPGDIINSFPLPSAPNLTRDDIEYRAMKDLNNVITISQPELNGTQRTPTDNPYDNSDQFIVVSPIVERYLKGQREFGHRDEYAKWRLGVGIGVGVGVPILMVITAFSTWVALKRIGVAGSRNKPN